MKNGDLKRFYPVNPNEDKHNGFARYDENGNLPGGSGGFPIKQDLNDPEFIPVENTYYMQESGEQPGPQMTAFTIGDTLSNGDKIHFDTSKEAELANYLNNLEYDQYNQYELLTILAGNNSVPVLGALDLTSMGNNAKAIFTASGQVVFATEAGSISGEGGTISFVQGFNNLDGNGDITLDLTPSGQSSASINAINDTTPPTWNGVIIGTLEEAPESQFEDGVIYFYDGTSYKKVPSENELPVIAPNKYLHSDAQGKLEWGDIKAESIDSESSTAGQVLTSDGNGGASWQSSAGGTTLNKYRANIDMSISSGRSLLNRIVNNAKSISFILNGNTVITSSQSNILVGTLSTGHVVFTEITVNTTSVTIHKCNISSGGTVSNDYQYTLTTNGITYAASIGFNTTAYYIEYLNDTEIT